MVDFNALLRQRKEGCSGGIIGHSLVNCHMVSQGNSPESREKRVVAMKPASVRALYDFRLPRSEGVRVKIGTACRHSEAHHPTTRDRDFFCNGFVPWDSRHRSMLKASGAFNPHQVCAPSKESRSYPQLFFMAAFAIAISPSFICGARRGQRAVSSVRSEGNAEVFSSLVPRSCSVNILCPDAICSGLAAEATVNAPAHDIAVTSCP